MYCSHDKIRTPEENTTIWRYLDFAKFVYMLQNQCLYFSRLDCLEDPHESSIMPFLLPLYPKVSKEELPEFRDAHEKLFALRKEMGVNCWHMADSESMAMWKIYGRQEYGLAIISSVGDLCKAFEDEENKIYVGEVTYSDRPDWKSDEFHIYAGAFRKGACYVFENELRALVHNEAIFQDKEIRPEGTRYRTIRIETRGVRIQVNLSRLIKKIIVHPEARLVC